jgi:hypothetical protein
MLPDRDALYHAMEMSLVLAVDTNALVCAADADYQIDIACRNWLESSRAQEGQELCPVPSPLMNPA